MRNIKTTHSHNQAITTWRQVKIDISHIINYFILCISSSSYNSALFFLFFIHSACQNPSHSHKHILTVKGQMKFESVSVLSIKIDYACSRKKSIEALRKYINVFKCAPHTLTKPYQIECVASSIMIIFGILAFHKNVHFTLSPCSFNVQHSFAYSHITLGNFDQLNALHSSGSEVAALPLDCVYSIVKSINKSPMTKSIFHENAFT